MKPTLSEIMTIFVWLCLLAVSWLTIYPHLKSIAFLESFAILVFLPLMFATAWFVGVVRRKVEGV